MVIDRRNVLVTVGTAVVAAILPGKAKAYRYVEGKEYDQIFTVDDSVSQGNATVSHHPVDGGAHSPAILISKVKNKIFYYQDYRDNDLPPSVGFGGELNGYAIRAGSGTRGGELYLSFSVPQRRADGSVEPSHGGFDVRDATESVEIVLTSPRLGVINGKVDYGFTEVFIVPNYDGRNVPLVIIKGEGRIRTGLCSFLVNADVTRERVDMAPRPDGATPLVVRGENSRDECEVFRNGRVQCRRNPEFRRD